MISGSVTPRPEMVVQVLVHGPAGSRRNFKAVIDPGFDGSLMLPLNVIGRMKLPWRRSSPVELADGSVIVSQLYEATVEWDGPEKRVFVDAAEIDPLLGMELLKGYHLDAEIRTGGTVRLVRLPRKRSRKARWPR
jgi:clan AA aspartic protease